MTLSTHYIEEDGAAQQYIYLLVSCAIQNRCHRVYTERKRKTESNEHSNKMNLYKNFFYIYRTFGPVFKENSLTLYKGTSKKHIYMCVTVNIYHLYMYMF